MAFELWRTLGLAATTMVVAGIHPSGNSDPSYLVAVGTELYFSANNGKNDFEAWEESDETGAGTRLVKDHAGPGVRDRRPCAAASGLPRTEQPALDYRRRFGRRHGAALAAACARRELLPPQDHGFKFGEDVVPPEAHARCS